MILAKMLFGLAVLLFLASWLLPRFLTWRERRREAQELEDMPEPPQNVRIRYPDGHEEPVELLYQGRDHRGFHVWVATPTAPELSREGFFGGGVHVLCDVLPAMTSVVLRGRG